MPSTEVLCVTFRSELTGSMVSWWHWKLSAWRQRRECPLQPFEKVRTFSNLVKHWYRGGTSFLKSTCFNLKKTPCDSFLIPFLLTECKAVLLTKLSVSWSLHEGDLCVVGAKHVIEGGGTCWPVYSLMWQADTAKPVIRKGLAAATACLFQQYRTPSHLLPAIQVAFSLLFLNSSGSGRSEWLASARWGYWMWDRLPVKLYQIQVPKLREIWQEISNFFCSCQLLDTCFGIHVLSQLHGESEEEQLGLQLQTLGSKQWNKHSICNKGA